MPLQEALQGRRSRRTFSDLPLTEPDLSHWLHASAALQTDTLVPGVPGRPYPSAGGLYAARLHLVLQHVDAWDPGVYRYDPVRHGLCRSDTDLTQVNQALHISQDPALSQAGAVAFVTVQLDDLLLKYGDRGYRFALQESGHIMQNLLLMAHALGLEALPLGSFLDDVSADLLNLTPEREVVLYAVAVGRSSQPDPERERPTDVGDRWVQWRLTGPTPLEALEALSGPLRFLDPDGLRQPWFMLKGDGGLHARLRLRVLTTESAEQVIAQTEPVLNRLMERRLIVHVTRGLYEPEFGLFGGRASLESTHRLFSADSHVALEARRHPSGASTLLSQLWSELMLRALALDSFERWDVWQQVRALRPGDSAVWATPTERMRPAMTQVHVRSKSDLVRQFLSLMPDGQPVLAVLDHWGEELQRLNRDGSLEQGIRSIAARCLLFHWNRMFLDPAQQGFLAQLRLETSSPPTC